MNPIELTFKFLAILFSAFLVLFTVGAALCWLYQTLLFWPVIVCGLVAWACCAVSGRVA